MDEDILKTLQSIEKLLKSSAMLGGKSSIANAAQRAKETLKSKFQRDEDKTYKAVSKSMKDLDGEVTVFQKRLGNLNSEVSKTAVNFSSLNSHMVKFMASIQPVQTAAQPVTNNLPGRNPGTQGAAQGFTAAGNAAGSAAGNMFRLGKNSAVFGLAMEGLSAAVEKMTQDIFALARVGLGTTDSLLTLYKGALTSGMSLADYTKVIQENISFAARAGSLARFDEITSAANSQLRALGVFGAESKELQSSLANSMTMMGISQAGLTSEIRGQIDVFGELRKSTNMTANQFGELVKGLSQNESVQKELIGLAPAERNARMRQLIDISTTGQRLGLAAEESKKLADAMIAQRQATVKDRFESAGRIRQLGAFLGMGADAERAAQLQMKGRRRSREEDLELKDLAGRLNAGAQRQYEQGGIGVQSVLDMQLEKLDATPFGKLMAATPAGELAGESAQVFNKDFGKSVGAFGQFVGQLMTYGKGITASPLGLLGAGLGGAALVAFRSAIFGPIVAAIQAGGGVIKTVSKPFSTLGSMFASVGGFAGALGKSLGLLGKVFLPITGVIELFTGNMRDALDPQGGIIGTIGGMLTSMLAAIPNTILSVFEFVFGENLMAPVQNVFDKMYVGLNVAIKTFLAKVLEGVEWMVSWLPEDSGLLKMIQGAKESMASSAQANNDTFNKLFKDDNATLSSIAEANRKQSESNVKGAKEATTKIQQAQQKLNNVQYGAAIDANQVISDARAYAANPQVQVPTPITPPEAVNKDKPETTSSAPVNSESDSVALLRSILAVLTRSATAEELQAELAALQLQQSKPRPEFSSAEERASRLLKNMRGLA